MFTLHHRAFKLKRRKLSKITFIWFSAVEIAPYSPVSPQEDIEEKDKLKTYYNALNTWVSAYEVIHQSLNSDGVDQWLKHWYSPYICSSVIPYFTRIPMWTLNWLMWKMKEVASSSLPLTQHKVFFKSCSQSKQG